MQLYRKIFLYSFHICLRIIEVFQPAVCAFSQPHFHNMESASFCRLFSLIPACKPLRPKIFRQAVFHKYFCHIFAVTCHPFIIWMKDPVRQGILSVRGRKIPINGFYSPLFGRIEQIEAERPELSGFRGYARVFPPQRREVKDRTAGIQFLDFIKIPFCIPDSLFLCFRPIPVVGSERHRHDIRLEGKLVIQQAGVENITAQARIPQLPVKIAGQARRIALGRMKGIISLGDGIPIA